MTKTVLTGLLVFTIAMGLWATETLMDRRHPHRVESMFLALATSSLAVLGFVLFLYFARFR